MISTAKSVYSIGLLALVCLMLPSPLHADAIIYNGGGPDQVSLQYADANSPYTMVAESFVLAPGASTITDAQWWGGCFNGVGESCPTSNFTLAFYTDNSGGPGTLVTSFNVGNANQTLTGNFITQGHTPEYVYSAAFAPIALTTGTTYWFAVGNNTGQTDTWAMESTNETGSHAVQFSGSWFKNQPNALAFNLTGPVAATPEPSSLLLLGSGLLGLVGMTWRRKRLA